MPGGRQTPKVLVLHRAPLEATGVEQRQGFAVTRPLQAIADLAMLESVSRDIVEQALTGGRRKGIITGKEVAELRRRANLPPWFDALLAANMR